MKGLGFLATILGIIGFFPVLYVVYKTKKTNNFPYKTLILLLISNFLWILHAFSKDKEDKEDKKDKKIDYQIAFMGSLYFMIYSFIFYVKCKS